jgi:predicted HicB family RNase H-like nuclease
MSNIITYKDYYGSVEFSAEDEVFYGKVLGINDLVSFEGKSVASLKASFREAVNDYLETCKQMGRQADKTYKGSFNVRVTPDLHKEAAIIARKKSMTLNEFVKFALSYVVQHEKEIAPALDVFSLKGKEILT